MKNRVVFLAALFVFASFSFARADALPDEKQLQARISQIIKNSLGKDATTLFTEIAALKPIQTQDDTPPLLEAADFFAKAGQHDKAIEIWQRVLEIPAAPGARPPGMMPAPMDWRGEARWNIAESKRAQGKWAQALALYRLNRETYPRDDGCVPSGAAFQAMMVVEGICLENLRRPAEAVSLYWPAAIHLSNGVSPLAMRRLFDLYSQNGNLSVLEGAMARETKAFEREIRINFTGDDTTPIPDKQQKAFQNQLADSAAATFEEVRKFRGAAQRKQFDFLLQSLASSDATEKRSSQREILEALALFPLESRQRLQKKIAIEPARPLWKAALLYFEIAPAQRRELLQNRLDVEPEVDRIVGGWVGYEWGAPAFPPIRQRLDLPTQLPAVVGAQSAG